RRDGPSLRPGRPVVPEFATIRNVRRGDDVIRTMAEPSVPARVDLDDLMSHERWLRRLVRGLVDEHGVEDVLQETWVAAWLHPPRDATRLRHWLARVAKRVAISRRRREQRRAARELRAARREERSSPEESVVRLHTMHRVVAAVLALDE